MAEHLPEQETQLSSLQKMVDFVKTTSVDRKSVCEKLLRELSPEGRSPKTAFLRSLMEDLRRNIPLLLEQGLSYTQLQILTLGLTDALLNASDASAQLPTALARVQLAQAGIPLAPLNEQR